MIFRRTTGWAVAAAYRLAGARRRALARWRVEGAVLPIACHALPAPALRALLTALRDLAGADALRAGKVDLSFDDGWRELAEAVRVLEEFEMPATVFVAPGETLRGNVWTETAQRLGVSAAEWRGWYALDETARVARLAARGAERVPRRLLTADELRALAHHPLLRFGNHTWSHLSCPHRPAAEVLDEVDCAQRTLTDWFGRAPTDFAYPFGRGTPALDAAIRARGLVPHYTRQGFTTAATRGAARNLAVEDVTDAENLARVLTAWPKVGVTR